MKEDRTFFKFIYTQIFDIDNGRVVEQDEARFNAAQSIATEMLDFLSWYSGMPKEKLLSAYHRFNKEKAEASKMG